MRQLVFILLSAALPAHAGLEQMVKDALQHEIERKMPVPKGPPMVVFDPNMQPKAPHYNMHWRLYGRLGPITYRDDLLDGEPGRFNLRPQGGMHSLRPENLTKFYFEIRKDF